MKIKKLFHWLYAILMLLPVFYIGGRVLYTIFNKNAKDSYSGETTYQINYKYQSNEVNSVNDLVEYNLYHFEIVNKSIDEFITMSNNFYLDFTFVNVDYYSFSYYSLDFEEVITSSYQNYGDLTFNLYTDDSHTSFSTYLTDNGDNDYFITLSSSSLDSAPFTLVGDFIYKFSSFVPQDLSFISKSNYNVIESVDIDTSGTLDNAFEYSVNQLNEVPLFSWAQNSFLNEPFTYISGLFGIAASNPINTMLSYWLSISIIWLVFDLVMYVPLLVHRWIDKGGID